MTADQEAGDPRVSVVVATFNRRAELVHTLDQLACLPERPPVVVVDNGSTDGSAAAVAKGFPSVQLVVAPVGTGPSARNLGVNLAATPYVAFADDDSWWTAGSLGRAADLFDRHPRLGLLAASIMVGPERRIDPVCADMAGSPLAHRASLPGVPVMGFIACAAIVRREAFEAVGGFHPLTRFGGEETLLAIDLAEAGWGLAYVDDLVAVHHPSVVRNAGSRRASELWNRLLRAWLRFPVVPALRATGQALTEAAASRCWPLGPLVARNTLSVVRQRAVTGASVVRDLALIGELPA